ncbi:rhodanese-like domain-containing protein [Psychromonas aquatilis]|uniref:Rhodanese-like domain-containing protein n=1 Tax=Psychromonas aquatilis TaxID=2005072 RepID=A0ABU9GM15_9GAMM
MKVKAIYTTLLLTLSVAFSSFSLADDIWIDVRTLSESLRDSIPGDIRISHSNIVREVLERYPDKNTPLHFYDKTGGRSDIAISALEREGYQNLYNAGSIEEAREERGLIK